MTRRPPLVLVACAAVAALVLPAAAAHAAAPGPYVALGDSFTAGPLVPNQVGRPAGCARSDHNYPAIVRTATAPPYFDDRSCSSATTEHMTGPQSVTLGVNPPQFNGLFPGAGLVTIGIGGNDVGLVGAAVTCIELGALAPTGTACRSHFAEPGGGDRLADQISATGPKIAATLQAIHTRSPHARVLVVGYPAVAPRDGKGCYPLIPLSDDDITYLESKLRETNAMLAEQAAANDAEFVDTYEDSTGHDACRPIGVRWFEGLVPMSLAFPVHPNALGEGSMAHSVLRVLVRPRPSAVLSTLRRSGKTLAPGRALRIAFTINREVGVTFTLQRASGGSRYARARNVLTAAAEPGENAVTLTAKQLGRRAGLYHVVAQTADGATQRTQFRIRRAR